VGHNCIAKLGAEALLPIVRVGCAESWSKFACIQVLVKTGRAVSHEAPVHRQHRFLLVRADAALDREDWQDAALVTLDTVVIPLAQFPTSLETDRTVSSKSPEKIFEVDVRCTSGLWDCRHD